jgi:hypothetical protein
MGGIQHKRSQPHTALPLPLNRLSFATAQLAGCPIHSTYLWNGWDPTQAVPTAHRLTSSPESSFLCHRPACRVPHPFHVFVEWVGSNTSGPNRTPPYFFPWIVFPLPPPSLPGAPSIPRICGMGGIQHKRSQPHTALPLPLNRLSFATTQLAGCPIHSTYLWNGWDPTQAVPTAHRLTSSPGSSFLCHRPACRVPHPFHVFVEWVGSNTSGPNRTSSPESSFLCHRPACRVPHPFHVFVEWVGSNTSGPNRTPPYFFPWIVFPLPPPSLRA